MVDSIRRTGIDTNGILTAHMSIPLNIGCSRSVESKKRVRLEFGIMILAALMLLQFFPLPKIPSLGFTPINCVFVLIILYGFARLRSVISVDPKIPVALGFTLSYVVLMVLLNAIQEETEGGFAQHIRNAAYIFSFVIVCNSVDRWKLVLKLFLVLAVASVLFGSLVYFVGSPFSAVRDWMHQSASPMAHIGKGSQLTGVYCEPHIFGYLLAGAPILAVGLYRSEGRLRWLGVFLVLLLGVLLNAERSTFLMNTLVLFAWFVGGRRNRWAAVGLLALVVLGLVLSPLILPSSRYNPNSSNRAASYQAGHLAERLQEAKGSDALARLRWQWNGIRAVLESPILGATREGYARIANAVPQNALTFGAATVMPPHNHYVNIGMHAGVAGWLILVVVVWLFRKVHIQSRSAFRETGPIILEKTTRLALIAVLGNALFHNAGLFSPELATSTVAALFLSLRNTVRVR